MSFEYGRIAFVLVGPPKTGSSYLASMLRHHPRLFVARENNFLYDDRDEGWDWWRRMFRKAPPDRIWGDYANTYSYAPPLAETLARLHPSLKIVFSIRHPVARAVSHFRHDRRFARLGPHVSLKEALDPFMLRRRYVEMGRYAAHVERFLDHFPAEQIYLFPFVGECADPQAALDDLLDFLGLPPCPLPVDRRVNRTFAPLWPYLHWTARFGSSAARIPALCLEPLNLLLGSFVGVAPVSDAEKAELRRLLSPEREAEALLDLARHRGIRHRLDLAGWSVQRCSGGASASVASASGG